VAASTVHVRNSWFAAWGRWTARHPWRVIAGWIGVVSVLVALMIGFGGDYQGEFAIPGTESQRAADLLAERFPAESGRDARIVFQSDGSVNDPAIRQQIEAVLDQARSLAGLIELRSPYETSAAISADGRTAFATLQFPDDESSGYANALIDLVERSGGPGLTVEAGGPIVEQGEQGDLGASELIGISAAAVILVLAFGSLVAMGVPIITALVSLGASFALLGIINRFVGMDQFTPSFAAMIGLGVGIDYALLVITRFRESLHRGMSPVAAVTVAVDTAGRSVLFAGTVVVIAMLGLSLIGIPFVAALGIAAALVVALAVLTGLTLMPAVLALLGARVDSWSIPMLRTHEASPETSVWYRFSHLVQRKPAIFAIAGVAVLLTLATPILDMSTSFTDAGNGSTKLHSRRAYDLLKEGFGPGFNGPLTIAVDLTGSAGSQLDDLRAELASARDVREVTEARVNEAGDTAVLIVYPNSGPQDSSTNSLIRALRSDVIPSWSRTSGGKAYITGMTATTIDLSNRITARTPLFFVMVIGLSFVVLAAVFRSIVIPATAAIMNLLSIGAAYGVVIAVFQWGWLAGPLGINVTGPIETFLPMMMFAILFGLSMDYEVFLVSRIREEYKAGRWTSEAIATGLSSTARVISSAALIMIAVFGSFVLGSDRVIKEFGLGLSAAIFLDATIVRLLLVPAVMGVLGNLNWWLPGALDRVLPAFDVEGHANDQQSAPAYGAAGD
jgi:RND superfamily putative drug exporter